MKPPTQRGKKVRGEKGWKKKNPMEPGPASSEGECPHWNPAIKFPLHNELASSFVPLVIYHATTSSQIILLKKDKLCHLLEKEEDFHYPSE